LPINPSRRPMATASSIRVLILLCTAGSTGEDISSVCCDNLVFSNFLENLSGKLILKL